MNNKILIADDSPLIRSIVSKILTSEGFEVTTAEDGLSAVKKAFSYMPDLIIMDISMPGINGFLACRLLKNDKNTSHIPIIILTSKKNPISKFWGKEVGANSYIVKTNEIKTIVAEVKKLLKDKKTKSSSLPLTTEEISDTKILGKISNLLDNELIKSTLRKMELESILHNINEAIIVIDRSNIIREINNYGLKLFEIKPSQIGKIKINDIFPNKDIITFKKLSQEENNFQNLEITYVKPHNKKHNLTLEYSVLRNFLSEVEYIVLFFRDITQQKEFERMKGEYFYNIVQEIRNPLSSAKEAINFLIEGINKNLTQTQKSVVKIIQDDLNRLIRFTDKIINISELELSPSILNITDIYINNIVENAVEKNKKMAKIKQIKINWKTKQKIKIKGDKEKLTEVFSNIISNAIKYNKIKGKIDIKIQKTQINKKPFAIVEIKDTGIGIDPSEIEVIFNKEKKVDARMRKQGGEFGLNLIIAKMVIDLHHGEIDVESKPEKGTKIRIQIPCNCYE